MIKENKIKVMLSYVVTLIPMLVGLCFWGKLGEGSESALRSVKIMATFVIPLFMILLNTGLLICESYQFKKRPQHKKIVALMLFIIPTVSLYASLIFYSVVLGWDISIQLLTSLLMGALFMVMGNYMPKSKQNRTFGLKIRWTLANEDNWNASHRVAGKTWFAVGFATLFTGFLPIIPFIVVFLIFVAVAMVVPTVYSYRYYKNNIKSGKQTEDDYDFSGVMNSKKATWIAIVIGVVVAVLCAILLFTGSVEFTLSDDALEIEATYHANESVRYEDIDAIEYRENADKGTRVMGFASARLLLGSFKNDELGAFTRFSYTKCSSDIIITVGNDKLAISCATESETQALYDAILEKLGK